MGKLKSFATQHHSISQVSKLDNDPASASVGPTRGALPRPAPIATPFRAFKRADINASELTREDLEAAGQDLGSAYGTSLNFVKLFARSATCMVYRLTC